MRKSVCAFLAFLFLSVSLFSEDLETIVRQLITSEKAKEQDRLIEDILKLKPSADTISTLLENITFDEQGEKGIVLSENLCIDGRKRSFCWYIPENYDPRKRTPLLVYLHGGVSRKELIEDPEKYVQESPFLPYAESEGYIVLFPFGQEGATWWNSVGVENIKSQIRITKRDFNIDDNRVYMTGFSDGASGSFFFAMCHPSDFAAFLPLNGHPGVGSLDGGIQTYFVNLFNRPLSVINTDEDALYPDKKISPMIALARKAGGDILYRIYTGIGHSFEYAEQEIPKMMKFMNTHPRQVNPSFIKWETVKNRHGRCMWLSVDSVIPGDIPEWYTDHNMELIDDRIVFGFYPDETHEGEGIRMSKVIDSTFAELVGAKDGNIIIKVENDTVTSMQVLNDYKATKKRGDPAEITVLRDNKKIVLKGHFPPPKKYNLFTRDRPSARAEVSFSANNFDIKSSQLGGFTIYIHPDMVQLDQPLLIHVNEELCYDDRINPDIEFLLRNFLENRDRELLYVKEIIIIR